MDNIDCECRACNPKCPGNCEDCLKEREEWKRGERCLTSGLGFSRLSLL